MSFWWVIGALGATFVVIFTGLALWHRKRMRAIPMSYASLSPDEDYTDLLLRSQVSVSLTTSSTPRPEVLTSLRQWATGTSRVAGDLGELQRELRTLQDYVLDLDARYVKKDENTSLTFQVMGWALGAVAAVATVVWAAVELAAHR